MSTICLAGLTPYKGGYGLNVFATFSKASSGFNAVALRVTVGETMELLEASP